LGAKHLEGQAILSDNRAVALVREGRMLGKQFTTTESAPVWRILRFFGLDNRRDKESPTADKRPPREPEDRKHQFAIWHVFAAFLGLC
jgi:cell division protease FtsH